MTTSHKQHGTTPSVWASSFRARARYVTDSDSDSSHGSDVDADSAAKPVSDDARLMREMDLSGRHETVEYRPNPWSIARINAASRTSLPKPALAPNPGRDRPLPQPQPKPIVEAFKKQAQRRDLKGDQPIVRDVGNLGKDSIGVPGVDKSCVAKHGGAATKKSRQGCEGTTPAQARVCPQHSPVKLNPPSLEAHKPQTGSTVHAVDAIQKEKSAHTSTFSHRFVESAYAPPPSKPRRIFGADRAAWSSPVRPFAPHGPPDVGNAVRDRPTLHPSSPGPQSRIPISARTMRHSLPLPMSAPACTNSRPAKIRNDLLSASPPSRFPENTDQRTVPSWLLDAIEEGIRVSAPPPLAVVPAPRQDTSDSPHIQTSEPKLKRLASPEPSPPHKIPRVGASRPPNAAKPPPTSASQLCPTAYTFGNDDDPDAEWSTLARTKRRAATSVKCVQKPRGLKQSGCFRLPFLGLAQQTPARAHEVKPRVITYLPPPKKLVDDVDSGPRASKNRQADEMTVMIDPPTRAPAKRDRVEREEQEEEEATEILMVDSDMTLVNEDDEDVAAIDVDDVCVRYPKTRAYMKAESRVRRVLGCVVELRV